MIVAAALLATGLLAPYAVRRLSRHTPPGLVVVANLAGLALAWLGVVDLVSLWAMPDHGLLGLCRAAFLESGALGRAGGGGVLVAAGGALGGRALWSVGRTCRAVRSIRRQIAIPRSATPGGPTFVDLGTVACTIGFLRPRIVVDGARFAALNPAQRRAVIAHERSHARGWHALIDLVARGLSAGLLPWPGARVAYGEIRRHLEAAADDGAARRTSRRDVAAAIVEAAAPAQPLVLGATGWTAWRVDRLLSPRPPRTRATMVLLGIVALTAASLVQLSGHMMTGMHLLAPAMHCCA